MLSLMRVLADKYAAQSSVPQSAMASQPEFNSRFLEVNQVIIIEIPFSSQGVNKSNKLLIRDGMYIDSEII